MTQSTISKKQQEIIKLIYRYRFVDRKQLQALMHLKDKKRLSVWLKDLREGHYIEWIYSTEFTEKIKPAIYYLGLSGIRFLKTLDEYPLTQLRLRYREAERTPDFIAQSILLADCCLDISAKNTGKLTYTFATQADYTNPQHTYHFLRGLQPDLYYERKEEARTGIITKDYLIVIFAAALPRYMTRTRLKDYVTYAYEGTWKRRFNGSELIIHIACPTIAELAYAKRRTRLLLNDIGRDKQAHIRFTTTEQVKLQGVTAIIWEES